MPPVKASYPPRRGLPTPESGVAAPRGAGHCRLHKHCKEHSAKCAVAACGNQRAIRVHFPSVARLACVLFVAVVASSAHAGDAKRWPAPFGGAFNANFTVTTDYSYAGISNTQLGPAFQVGLDYKTPSLIDAFPLWVFVTGFR